MRYLLAHDLGTSGNKATLFSEAGDMIASCTYSYETNWYNGTWAEQDPEKWYEAFVASTKEVIKDVDAADVVALSFSGQMMGCLCVDEKGEPLYPSIIWADSRATEEEAFIRSRISEEDFYDITGHRPSASYGLAKFLWLKNNRPDVVEKTYKILNAKDFILYKLTGRFVTDYSDASSTNLLDISTLKWSEKIAEAVGVDLAMMPEPLPSTAVVGSVGKEASEATGLSTETQVVCGGGDGSMSAVGAGCISDGDAFCTIGTSAWNATTDNRPIFDPEMRTFNWVHVVPGKYVPCGTMQAAGASLSWLKDNLAWYEKEQGAAEGVSPYERINEVVSASEPGANGVMYLPYLMGERSPRWNPEAKGSFIGMKMETSRGDMFRAVYEGVALNLDIILGLVMGDRPLSHLVMTGGGAKSDVWRQIFADIYGVTIQVPSHMEEATSIGAVVTAGVGVGIYPSFDVIHNFIEIIKETEPIEPNSEVYREIKPLFEGMYQALLPVYHQLTLHEKQRIESKES